MIKKKLCENDAWTLQPFLQNGVVWDDLHDIGSLVMFWIDSDNDLDHDIREVSPNAKRKQKCRVQLQMVNGIILELSVDTRLNFVLTWTIRRTTFMTIFFFCCSPSVWIVQFEYSPLFNLVKMSPPAIEIRDKSIICRRNKCGKSLATQLLIQKKKFTRILCAID